MVWDGRMNDKEEGWELLDLWWTLKWMQHRRFGEPTVLLISFHKNFKLVGALLTFKELRYNLHTTVI